MCQTGATHRGESRRMKFAASGLKLNRRLRPQSQCLRHLLDFIRGFSIRGLRQDAVAHANQGRTGEELR